MPKALGLKTQVIFIRIAYENDEKCLLIYVNAYKSSSRLPSVFRHATLPISQRKKTAGLRPVKSAAGLTYGRLKSLQICAKLKQLNEASGNRQSCMTL
jgi:hypothetical protein